MMTSSLRLVTVLLTSLVKRCSHMNMRARAMQATAAQEPGDVASLALHTALQALLSETRQSRHSDSTVGPLSSDDSSSSPGISVTDDCSSKLHQDQQIQTKRPKRQRKDRVPTYYLRKVRSPVRA